MPPRVASRSGQAVLPRRPRTQQSSHHDHISSSPSSSSQSRSFSQSPAQPFHASCRQATRLRRNMFAWLNGPGRAFREPLPSSTNYLGAYDRSGYLLRLRDNAAEEEEEEGVEEEENSESKQEKDKRIEEEEEGLDDVERQQRKEVRDAEAEEARENRNRNEKRLPKEGLSDLRPFPLNQSFRSQAVLSEELREEIWRQVVNDKQSVQTVSAVFGVDMRRVAAVVRLKTVEKDWVTQGKKLATPYQSAVLGMLPQTGYNPRGKITPHESINDLPVHPATRQQIFYPAAESRQFTRADAAKVFSPTLLPADERIPHPELIQLEKDIAAQIPREQRVAAVRERDERLRKEKEDADRRKKSWEEKNLKTVEGQRWTFKFQDISVDTVGKNGRGQGGVGWRYGMPHQDRKRGQVKIPTSVE